MDYDLAMMLHSLTIASGAAAILFIAGAAQCQTVRISPRGSTTTVLSGKTIRIEYGRPYRKGRQIFGTLVPYGKLWRTGADESTVLAIDGSLTIGSLTVPPGGYSLLTIPGKDSWILIINREAELLSPTRYNRKQDLGRVNMSVSKSAQTVEQLTIVIDKTTDSTGVLSIAWENTVASVPVSAPPGEPGQTAPIFPRR